MSVIKLTNASIGATRNSGTNGDLTTLLDWALPQASWSIEYSSGNARVYRPGSGNRFRLHVNHDSATSGAAQVAVVRGCENASAATTLTDPFPTVAQVANNSANWRVSTTASTVDRAFIIYLSETWVIYCSNVNGSADVWDVGFFGDVSPNYPSDSWNTLCMTRNSSTPTAGTYGTSLTVTSTLATFSGNIHWVRDISGAIKSSYGQPNCSGGSFGIVTGTQPSRGGYLNAIPMERVGFNCAGSSASTAGTLGLVRRGWFPNIWSGLFSSLSSVTDADTFTNTTYNPSAIFRALKSNATGSLIFEETDTWSPP